MRLLAEAQRDDELIYDIDELISSTNLLHIVRAKKIRMIYRRTYRFERLIPVSNRAPTPRYVPARRSAAFRPVCRSGSAGRHAGVATEFYHVWDLT